MVGRDVDLRPTVATLRSAKSACNSKSFRAGATEERRGLRAVSLEVRSGEILGIAGVSGNGQCELAEVITGLRKTAAGRVSLEGEDVTGLGARLS